MLKTSCGWTNSLLLAWLVTAASGIIEIVEEQRCHDHEFRLTCRDLQTHIAILEGWYTSLHHLRDNRSISEQNVTITKQNKRRDIELDQVFVYSSPKHDGLYETVNRSLENATESYSNVTSVNDTSSASDVLSVTSVTNESRCGVQPYSRSYASWKREGRRVEAPREASINLRAPLSYRCTGVNHCSFILVEDLPAPLAWAPGIVYIKYACFDDLVSVHYCNRQVAVGATGSPSEGYVRTPGYPHFYAGGACSWKLVANGEQRIRVTLLDVSLRSIGPYESECTDYVEITESSGTSLLSTCKQPELPLRLISSSSSVDVLVRARSRGAFPKRGVLLHYKSVGCVTLSAPSNGYLIYRDVEIAHYMCNVRYVFADTRERSRLLKCYDDNIWNDTVPFCIEETRAVPAANDSVLDSTPTDVKLANESNMIVDIVIPSLLIAVLFIGNAFIVLVIYKYRKRKTDETEDEFNTIPLNVNGNVHSAGNAV